MTKPQVCIKYFCILKYSCISRQSTCAIVWVARWIVVLFFFNWMPFLPESTIGRQIMVIQTYIWRTFSQKWTNKPVSSRETIDSICRQWQTWSFLVKMWILQHVYPLWWVFPVLKNFQWDGSLILMDVLFWYFIMNNVKIFEKTNTGCYKVMHWLKFYSSCKREQWILR